MYHAGNRALQRQFGSTALADRLVEKLHRERFTDADKQFIESLGFFFLATADAQGRPDCSFKGGAPGFTRVVGPELLVFPDYDGNGMFKSLGNILQNPFVGLLFIAMQDANACASMARPSSCSTTRCCPSSRVRRRWCASRRSTSFPIARATFQT